MSRYPYKGRRFWKLIFTTCKQAGRAPFIDRAWTVDREGNSYTSCAILLRPWMKNQYGERPIQRAIVIGWKTGEHDQA